MFVSIRARTCLQRFGFAAEKHQVRYLSVQEHVAQKLLDQNSLPVPRGQVVATAEEAAKAATDLGGTAVLKSQILAGGRGKGVFDNGFQGGVHVAHSPTEARDLASKMLGHRLITKQTKSDGLTVKQLYVTEKIEYQREFYLSFAIDRATCNPVVVVSRSGGMNIEKAAKENPGSIIKVPLSYRGDISQPQLIDIANTLNITSSTGIGALRDLLLRMYKLFKTKDATLLEINPLVETASGQLMCLDSKFSFDDAAEYRQEDLFAATEPTAEINVNETLAKSLGFAYVGFDGTIGNIANGAGLAMATMDAISYFGGTCANFLDAGGKATRETMLNALRIVLGDERVRVLFINNYGGIIGGDMVADAIISAARELSPLRVPLVVRLRGTNAKQGQDMLARSGLGIHNFGDFSEAVQKAVELSKV